MSIKLHEVCIASKNIEKMKEFYSNVMSEGTKVDFKHDFFYTLQNSDKQISIVPHNGDAQWDKPWLTLTSDNIEEAITHIKGLGVDESTIERMPLGITFRDPDGHLVMIMEE